MNTIVIKDLNEGASDVRELTGKEMESTKGGQGVMEPFGAWAIVDAIAAPINLGDMIQKYKDQQHPK
jgi:hypothetical protein